MLKTLATVSLFVGLAAIVAAFVLRTHDAEVSSTTVVVEATASVDRATAAQSPTFDGELPHSISELGIFSTDATFAAKPGVIPYTVNYPLWSDGTIKHRHIYLPPGKKIEVDPEGGFYFPDGTIATKTFLAPSMPAGKRHTVIETRVLAKHAGKWKFGAYVWNDEGTDAEISDGRDVEMSYKLDNCAKNYVVPGRMTCLACHAGVTDTIIGFAGYQLSPPVLDQIVAAGHLDRSALPLPNQFIAAESDLERRALGYLGGNCAHCHNPSSSAYRGDELDLRPFATKEETINVAPERLMHPDAKIIVEPGRPEESVLYRLFVNKFTLENDSDKETKMPPIGNCSIDATGALLVRDWILSLRRD